MAVTEKVDPTKKWTPMINKSKELSVSPFIKMVVYSNPGTGKCLGKGTFVLMHNGSEEVVQNIKIGDKLMGPDSNPRTVTSLGHGFQPMYKIVPVKGKPFTCNKDHILHLKLRKNLKTKILNITVEEFLETVGNSESHRYKLIRTGVDFPTNKVPFDPYIIGVWLGNGTVGYPSFTKQEGSEIIDYVQETVEKLGFKLTNLVDKNTMRWNIVHDKSSGRRINEFLNEIRRCIFDSAKRIPEEYLYNNRHIRLELLAGLIDTDGHLDSNVYEIITKYAGLSEDILFLARSLGFAAYVSKKTAKIKSTCFVGEYYRIIISGHIDKIPVKVAYKKALPRRQIKDVLVTGFSVEPLGIGEYFGFTLLEDPLFLLNDFTITHNTSLSGTAGLVPEMCHVLHINTGEEISALIRAEKLALTGTEIVGIPTPDSIDFESVAQMDQLRWWLVKEEHQYKTIIIDTISRISQIVLDQVVSQSIKRNPTMSNGSTRDLNDTNMDDYGKTKKTMTRLMGTFVDLPMNVIFLAHERNFAKEGKPNKIGPAMSEGISDILCGMVSIVGHMETKAKILKDDKGEKLVDEDGKVMTESHRMIRFERRGDGVECKDRTTGQKLGKQILDPTMKDIWERINS